MLEQLFLQQGCGVLTMIKFLCKQNLRLDLCSLRLLTGGKNAHTHTLALLPLVKRQVFCVRDRLKMVKRSPGKLGATTFVTPKLEGSMTTKGQMKHVNIHGLQGKPATFFQEMNYKSVDGESLEIATSICFGLNNSLYYSQSHTNALLQACFESGRCCLTA